jgi:4-amino-4-deoxy-L-arabinose transferase-like glycosyltransferase
MRAQEFIHSLESGWAGRVLKGLTLFLALLALATLHNLAHFRHFSSPEAMDHAQLARNLAEGRGYTTQFIRPFSVWLIERHRGANAAVLDAPHPDLANAPAYPWLLAQWMKLAPADNAIAPAEQFKRHEPELRIAWLNQALFFLALVLMFRLALRLFDPFVAWMAVCTTLASDLLWKFSLSGLPTLLGLVLVLAIAWCLAAAEQGHRVHKWGWVRLPLMAVLVGSLVGAAALTKYPLALLLLPVLVFFGACFDSKRVAMVLLALAAFAGVVAPWLARNHAVSGTLLGAAGYAIHEDGARFPGSRLMRAMNPANPETPADLAKVDLDEYWSKFWPNAARLLTDELPRLGGSWLAAFFLPALFIRFNSPTLARLRGFTLASLGLLALAQALCRTHLDALAPETSGGNLLVMVAPLVFVFGVGMFSILLDQMQLDTPAQRGMVAMVFLAVMCVPLLFTLCGPRRPSVAWPPYYPPFIAERAGWVGEKGLMMSDAPWAVAWYGRRDCAWLTWDAREDFQSLHRRKPVRALYLTQLTLDQRLVSEMLRGEEKDWGMFAAEAVVLGERPENFPLRYAFTEGFPDQLFMAEKEFWKPAPK